MDKPEETNKLMCPCCSESFATEDEKIAHIKAEHDYHRLTPQPKIGRKYSRIVGQIEKCFVAYRKRNIEVLTVTQIEHWLKDNTKAGLAKQRISSLLRRRPQFLMHRKARRINSNEMETWWSLGDIDEDIDYSGYSRWVDQKTGRKLN